MSKTLKKILVSSASLLMLASIGSGVSNLTTSASTRKPRTSYHYSKKNKYHAYLEVYKTHVIPENAKGNNADVGYEAPTVSKHYDNYLNGYYNIYSKRGYYTDNSYHPRGVKITDHAGTYKLAKAREPFRALRSKNVKYYSKNTEHNDTAPVLEVMSKNKAWRGWINPDGMYFYGGSQGKLPLHFAKAHKKIVRHHIKKHVNKKHVKRTKITKHRGITKKHKNNSKKVLKHKSHKALKQMKLASK